jgi:hypothetical protein
MAAWWLRPRRLGYTLRLLSRGVVAIEQHTAALEAIAGQVARVAEAMEAWNQGVVDAAQAAQIEEVPVPSLQEVLRAAASPVMYSPVPSGRSFRTARPAESRAAAPDEAVGGVTYRDAQTLLRAWEVEQRLTATLGRGPSEQELAEALAVEEGRA